MTTDINNPTAEQDETAKANMEDETIWFCPSRWLLAHYDPQANISTMSSHICLADLNNDGENLLALVDFKQNAANSPSPYQSRLRVYRGKHLIYNHFLDELPACMFVSSNRVPITTTASRTKTPLRQPSPSKITDKLLLTLPINDDIYFYHQLKPQHRISLEDDERILDTLNRSELDAWHMVKRNEVDVETMRELLVSLNEAHGGQELTSHSNNFLALATSEERKNYLLLWKFKKLSDGTGEHIMSMDSICCAAARLRYDASKLSDQIGSSKYDRWNKLLDIQKDGIVLATEDRHLLVYELGYSRAYLEANYRLPSTADHVLVERLSPMNIDPKGNLQELTYKIIVSCRNCRIYSIDQKYLLDRKHNSGPVVRELIALSSNVIDMCWTAEDDLVANWSAGENSPTSPNFIVACHDRRVYCFLSRTGQIKWTVELELPITCLVSFPIPRVSQDETCLIGVASQTNRVDFYIGSTGRIVDSIYLSDDFCQAMTFGRFGREDNCLCLTTSKGSLIILILKRTAKFANAQCLSSAAAYASHVVAASCYQARDGDPTQSGSEYSLGGSGQTLTRVREPPQLPKPFAITKSTVVNPTDRALDQLQLNHNCEQGVAKEALDSHLVMPKLQIPAKNRDFVDQIVLQARQATTTSKAFARDMLKLRDKVRLASEHHGEMISYENANRVSLTNVTGLGNIYRVSLSLCLEVPSPEVNHGVEGAKGDSSPLLSARMMKAQVIIFVADKQRRCHLQPFRFELELKRESIKALSQERDCKKFISETLIEFKLTILDLNSQPNSKPSGLNEEESITLDVHVLPPKPCEALISGLRDRSTRPALVSSINIPTCQ